MLLILNKLTILYSCIVDKLILFKEMMSSYERKYPQRDIKRQTD